MVITLSCVRTRRSDPPSHGQGGGSSRGWGNFIINSFLMGRFGGLVMDTVEGLVEGGGHGHHPLRLRTTRADPPSHGRLVGLVKGAAALLLTTS